MAANGNSGSSIEDVLVLDVDGTLYGPESGVEAQIVSNIYKFAAGVGVSPDECERLRDVHGSTLRGLVDEGLIDERQWVLFYKEVYEPLDLSRLRRASAPHGDATGYRHEVGWAAMLRAWQGPRYLASDSPRFHVERVVAALGLADIPWDGVLCPDTRQGRTKSDPEFYRALLDRHSSATRIVTLLDDSDNNLRVAASLGLRGVKISADFPIGRALSVLFGAVPHPKEWSFDELAYLRDKNIVDEESRNTGVWQALENEIATLQPADNTLRVVDIGAGLLPLLSPVLRLRGPFSKVEYVAFETSAAALDEAACFLQTQDFAPAAGAGSGGGGNGDGGGGNGVSVFHRAAGAAGLEATVVLRQQDFTEEPATAAASARPDLIIGACLADLLPPRKLVAALDRLAGESGALVYLPITFAGTSACEPPAPRMGAIPSDEDVMEAYGSSLVESQGHFVATEQLMQVICGHGGRIIARGPSDWVVSRGRNPVLWDSLLYFFGLGTAPRLVGPRCDLRCWVARTRELSPDFRASNVDILARTVQRGEPPADLEGQDIAPRLLSRAVARQLRSAVAEERSTYTNTFLEFVAPGDVQVRQEEVAATAIGPRQLLIETCCSAVSSGTELKVFRGDFDGASALDTAFAGMADQTMRYPLRYGYSLVGRVLRCGAEVSKPEKLLGKLVFTFSAHASLVVADADSVKVVPEGIAAEDAIHLPAVETALSLVQDACPRVGERVAVFGQGMIGLLVTAILAKAHGGVGGGCVAAVDVLPARRHAARRAGATHALGPDDLAATEPFDLSIEVSGNPRGLQSAIDRTGYGGRIIMGSWYGAAAAALRLGLNFHRSHLTLQTSQVSNVAAGLSDRWDKQRRFACAWELVRALRPGRLLQASSVPIEKAQEAYEALEAGRELAVHVVYY